jgi:hypothetical protein
MGGVRSNKMKWIAVILIALGSSGCSYFSDINSRDFKSHLSVNQDGFICFDNVPFETNMYFNSDGKLVEVGAKMTSNKVSEATSEPARGAAFSSPQD